MLKKSLILVVLILIVYGSSACSSKKKQDSQPQVLTVSTGKSIQQMIDKANPGDMIVIQPGTYGGDIVITTKDLTVRGENRNTVIIDGRYKQDNGITVAADGVRIENLTVQAFKTNGILFQGGYVADGSNDDAAKPVLARYKLDYVNALNNGLYGIYGFSSTDGEISNTYTRANADAGIYVGQCSPCRTAVYLNKAEMNGIGYQGANASKSMAIYSNDFSNNRTGIHLLSETKEQKAPQVDVNVVSNLVSENNADAAPTTTPELYGFGIVVAGGRSNNIEKNTANKNAQAGLVLVNNGEYLPEKNAFKSNESRENGFPVGFDIAYIITGRNDVMSLGNCFESNSYSSSSIDTIEKVLPCQGAGTGPFPSQQWKKFVIPAAPGYDTIPIEPQNQKSMPGNINTIPKTLGKLKMPDLSKLGLYGSDN